MPFNRHRVLRVASKRIGFITMEYNLLVFTGHSSDEHIVWNKTRFNEFRIQFDTLKAAQEFVAMLVTQ